MRSLLEQAKKAYREFVVKWKKPGAQRCGNRFSLPPKHGEARAAPGYAACAPCRAVP